MIKTAYTCDVNCVLGNWPFRKIRKNNLSDIQSMHQQFKIETGYISSLNSIFYNDPFEGDEELHELIKDTSYHHVLTINPKLPGFEKDIEKGLKSFQCKGVKVYPTYHKYNLADPDFQRLCNLLRDYDLPLFLPMRMEDARLDYLVTPTTLSVQELMEFINEHPKNEVILLTIYYRELITLRDTIIARKNITFDTSGLKDGLFNIEKLLELFPPSCLSYGSLYPLYSFTSSYFLIDKAQISNEIKQKILQDKVVGLD